MIYDKLAGQLPLPRLLASQTDQLELQWLPGVPGQELLENQPDAVLAAIGQLARQVHDVDLDQLPEADRTLPGGSVLVHGDFGPQNVLLDPETAVPTALVDWELTHVGHPVEDLAWAEWIVRTHHAAVVDRLPALFDGYGDRPRLGGPARGDDRQMPLGPRLRRSLGVRRYSRDCPLAATTGRHPVVRRASDAPQRS